MPMASSQAAAGSGTGVIDSATRKRRGRRAGQKVAATSDQVEIGEGEGLGRGRVASRRQPPSTSGPVAEQIELIGAAASLRTIAASARVARERSRVSAHSRTRGSAPVSPACRRCPRIFTPPGANPHNGLKVSPNCSGLSVFVLRVVVWVGPSPDFRSGLLARADTRHAIRPPAGVRCPLGARWQWRPLTAPGASLEGRGLASDWGGGLVWRFADPARGSLSVGE